MGKTDLTIFRYSTILTLTRNGISTLAELEQMTNEDIRRIRGLGKRGYDEILAVLGRLQHRNGLRGAVHRRPLEGKEGERC